MIKQYKIMHVTVESIKKFRKKVLSIIKSLRNKYHYFEVILS